MTYVMRPVIFSVAVARIEEKAERGRCLYLATETGQDGRGAGREQWIKMWHCDPWKRWVENTADLHEIGNEEAEAICAATPGAEKVRALR